MSYFAYEKHPLYNFEYFMNRPYTYNRDKEKCRICGGYVDPEEARFHHVRLDLPSDQGNKITNLITVHDYCHKLIHNDSEPENLSDKTRKKIVNYRSKLSIADK